MSKPHALTAIVKAFIAHDKPGYALATVLVYRLPLALSAAVVSIKLLMG